MPFKPMGQKTPKTSTHPSPWTHLIHPSLHQPTHWLDRFMHFRTAMLSRLLSL